jgi:hypothetical protein
VGVVRGIGWCSSNANHRPEDTQAPFLCRQPGGRAVALGAEGGEGAGRVDVVPPPQTSGSGPQPGARFPDAGRQDARRETSAARRRRRNHRYAMAIPRMSRAAADQDVFRAVADESRRTILEALAEGPHSFQELQALLTISRTRSRSTWPSWSRWVWCRAAWRDDSMTTRWCPNPLQEIDDWINRFRPCWTIYLEGLSEAMRRQAAARRARRPPSA